MPQRLPRSLIIGLAWMAGLSLYGSVFLEQRYLAYLQAHPITVNLISGVVGFATGILTVSVGLNWYLARSTVHDRKLGRGARYFALERAGKIVCATVPDSYYGRSAPVSAEHEMRCRDLVEASKRLWNLDDGDPEDLLHAKVSDDPADPRDFAALVVELEAYLLDYLPVLISPNLTAYPTMNFWRRRATRELEQLVQLTGTESPDPRRLRTTTLSVLAALANIEQLVEEVFRHDDEHLPQSMDVDPRSTETPLARVRPGVELSALRAKQARLQGS